MTGIEQLTPDNHTLFRRVTHLLNLGWKWEAIALDVGIYQINDIAEWYLDYRTPKALPKVRTEAPRAVVAVRSASTDPRKTTQQFIAWRREQEGAQKAREAASL